MYSLRYRDELEKIDGALTKEFEGLIGRWKELFLREHSEEGTHSVPNAPEAIPVGSIVMWAAPTAPAHWLICNGASVSRTNYITLFKQIGTTYGVGDGVTTFNLPNLQQRFPLGKAASGTGSTLGETGGTIDHEHDVNAHTHAIASGGAHTHTGSTGSSGAHTHTTPAHTHGSGSVSGFSGGDTSPDATTIDYTPGGTTSPAFSQDNHVHAIPTVTDSGGASNTGSDGAHTHSISSDGAHDHGGVTGSGDSTTNDANPPYTVVNFIILAGV